MAIVSKLVTPYSFLDLSQDENEMGRFLRDRGATDKTKAGKMMIAVGKAQSFSAQQRWLCMVVFYNSWKIFNEQIFRCPLSERLYTSSHKMTGVKINRNMFASIQGF